MPRKRLNKAPHNRRRPAGEAGRFWGYNREESYVSLYMWICGRWVSPVCAVGADVGSIGANYGAGLDLKVLVTPYVVTSDLILEQRTNVCAICV